MTIEVNYWLVGLLVIGLALLIIWLIKRDRKDEKDFKKTIIESEIQPEKKNDGEDKNLTP